jgi:type IV pilus biogenesis protein CpaD/CtpE
MKRLIFVLIVAASGAVVGCAESESDLVAKINAAYHTRFYVATPNDTTMVPGAR